MVVQLWTLTVSSEELQLMQAALHDLKLKLGYTEDLESYHRVVYLQRYLENGDLADEAAKLVVIDVRFDLGDPAAGRQAYVVSPLVDESANVAAASAEETFEALANGELEPFRLDLIHGRMTSHEKDAAMQAFRVGKTQVLVSTSVIEVGVDVPNATVLAILSPERFGRLDVHRYRFFRQQLDNLGRTSGAGQHRRQITEFFVGFFRKPASWLANDGVFVRIDRQQPVEALFARVLQRAVHAQNLPITDVAKTSTVGGIEPNRANPRK